MNKKDLIGILENPIAQLGYELVDLDRHLGPNKTIRLFIDKKGGVGIDDCAFVSEQVGTLLDVEGALEEKYILEVSSPGFDRRLRTQEHFLQFSGSRVSIKFKSSFEGKIKMTGIIKDTNSESVSLLTHDSLYQIPINNIDMAKIISEELI